MTLNLRPFELGAELAVEHFWTTRAQAAAHQGAAGSIDHGERRGVTAGKNMDGFVNVLAELAVANGLPDAEVHTRKSLLTLPGYFRPTKNWDMLITHHGRLIAAVELKSQVGPSFGNNFNNRAEEAIGTATDLWTAFREGALGNTRPFVGWLILVEDCRKSRVPGQRLDSPHFPVRPEFAHASYLDRYALLCTKLVRENLYTHAAVIASPRDAGAEGTYHDLTDSTSFSAFARAFAAHIAAV